MHGGSRHGSQPKTVRNRATPRSRTADANSGRTHVPAPDADRLERLLSPVVRAMNMDLESIRVTVVGRRRLLRVVVDADGGVSLDDIALASRELSIKLDAAATMGELPYTLEVSSPGVDRPLTQPRHWRRAVGRLVIAPCGDSTAEGRILGTTEAGVTLDRDGVTREYTYAELGPGRVQIEFGHLDDGSTGDSDAGEED